MPAGAPRQWDREWLLSELLQYIDNTEVPIVAEFAYQHDITRQQLYEMPELSDALKKLIAKKESSLEKGCLTGKLQPSMAIFSLKQLGWKDTHTNEVTGKDGKDLVPPPDNRELARQLLFLLSSDDSA
jgi:hypothetical protein